MPFLKPPILYKMHALPGQATFQVHTSHLSLLESFHLPGTQVFHYETKMLDEMTSKFPSKPDIIQFTCGMTKRMKKILIGMKW